jgi:endonuclease-3
MPTMTNKQQLLTQTYNLLKKQYDSATEEHEKRPIIEHLLYAICREGATRDKADKAFDSLRKTFFDWNEVRVSAVHEIADAMGKLPEAGAKAQRIVGVLQEWFEQFYNFDMEDLAKKGVKDAAKKLSRHKDVNDFHIAWVIQHGFGGHAIPLDEPTLRVLKRLGALEEENEDLEAMRGSIEHNVPKAKGSAFFEMLSLLADEVCLEDAPKCSACPLKDECPVGQERARSAPEPKPRKSR